MLFKSQAQRGYLYANNPKVAKEFEDATTTGVKLPYHVSSRKRAMTQARPRHGMSLKRLKPIQ